MRSIRIGNDIDIVWRITTANGMPYHLEGKDLILVVSSLSSKTEIRDFTVKANAVRWKFLGMSQKHTGNYRLTLIENREKAGMVTIDVCDAFCLSPCSCSVGGDTNGVSVESVELDSLVDMLLVKPIIPEIGADGNWIINGVNSGKPSRGEKGDAFRYEDFTPDQIRILQKPATDAALLAIDAAKKADNASTTANKATSMANTATGEANAAAKRANEAAVKVDGAISDAKTATGNANSATRKAADAAKLANEKAEAADRAAASVTQVITKANTATDEANKGASSANAAAVDANEAVKLINDALAKMEELEQTIVAKDRKQPKSMTLEYPRKITRGNHSGARIVATLHPTGTGGNVMFLSDGKAITVVPNGSLIVNGVGKSVIHVIPTENTSIYETIEIEVVPVAIRLNTKSSLRFTSGGAFRFM